MFDIGFWELALIGVVGLLVIGPERLPTVARNVGRWIGRFQRFVTNVKADIDREIQQEELKKALERDAGLDEIKEIMNTDDFYLEVEDEPDHLQKAIDDVDQKAAYQKANPTITEDSDEPAEPASSEVEQDTAKDNDRS